MGTRPGVPAPPVAGIAKDEVIGSDHAGTGHQHTPTWETRNWPICPVFKTAITGSQPRYPFTRSTTSPFCRRQPPRSFRSCRYDLWVAGAPSTAPSPGPAAKFLATPEDALDVWYGVIRIFRDYGYRRLRNKAWLKFLATMSGGRRGSTRSSRTTTWDAPCPMARHLRSRAGTPDHIGVHEQKDGRFLGGAASPVGRLSGDVPLAGPGRPGLLSVGPVRTTRRTCCSWTPADRVDDAVRTCESWGRSRSGCFHRSTLACTGLEFCKFAIVETKRLAARVGRLSSTRAC